MAGLFGGSKPKAPPIKPPAPLPDPESPLIREAARKRMAAFGQGGRASTDLTGGGGLGDYGGAKLGVAA